jgi:hypothetical protein
MGKVHFTFHWVQTRISAAEAQEVEPKWARGDDGLTAM